MRLRKSYTKLRYISFVFGDHDKDDMIRFMVGVQV